MDTTESTVENLDSITETSSARETATPDVLVAGGDSDPNIGTLIAALQARNVPHLAVVMGADLHPRITWDMNEDALIVNDQPIRPRSIFLRHDVFSTLATGRPEPAYRSLAWFTTISGWGLSHPEIRVFNRASAQHVTNKLHVLGVARSVGLEIPSTLVSNDHAMLTSEAAKREMIVKPANGGDYTRELKEVLEKSPVRKGSLAGPAIVQERLVPPEIRVYGINGRYFPYKLVADALDYRSTSACEVIPLELSDLPEGLTDRLAALMERLQMDFGAADFKASPETGRLHFLEINNGPMFTRFDAVSGGRLTGAMIVFLCP